MKSILQAESVINRQPLIVCNSSYLDESEELLAEKVGFDIIVTGIMSQQVLKELVHLARRKQEMFDNYAFFL